MKPIDIFCITFLSLMLHSCQAEKKEIKGVWIDPNLSNSVVHYIFERDGSYSYLDYGPDSPGEEGSWVFRDGSLGYYVFAGNGEFHLFQLDVDMSPIVGVPVTSPEIGMYLDERMSAQVPPDFEGMDPTYLAQVQGDGDVLQISQNHEILIVLNRKDIKFWDMR